MSPSFITLESNDLALNCEWQSLNDCGNSANFLTQWIVENFDNNRFKKTDTYQPLKRLIGMFIMKT